MFGWLFDVYPSGNGMAVWLIDRQGHSHELHDTFSPRFYAQGSRDRLRSLSAALIGRHAPVALRITERIDLFLDRPVEVLEVRVRAPGHLPRIFQQASRAFPDLTYYDADIPLPQRYVLEREIFPLAYCTVDVAQGRIQRIEALDTPWDTEYELPPLRVMTLRLDGDLQDPTRSFAAESDQGKRRDLLVEVERQRYRFPRQKGRQLVLGMRHLLERFDPDVLISAYGDNYILPRLLRLSRHYGIRVPLNRDPKEAVRRKGAHSYFSYGRVLFRNEQHTLFGRWHLDRQNAFLTNYYGLDGILEIARVSGLPVQTVARVSTGTGISAMQVATAQRRGVLVPWQKRQPESLKTGLDLFAADKGGLVYTPIAGLYEGVAELDFTAMYPSIMVHFNVSPETVGARCCEGETVPELGTSICRHRVGLVPETLAPLLEKRNRYKEMIRELPPGDPKRRRFERRYSAHKWLLVTCFGYLGYKNARFGRIEAHEAVNAYGREVLLQAKELVEEAGYRVLHLYVDGLWIQREGADQADYDRLLNRIQSQTGLRVGLEGIYSWLAFLPSRTEPRVAVANRYFGAYEDGSVKIRGVEARRHDTPPFIKDAQLEMLALLSQARGIDGYRAAVPRVVAYAQERLRALRAGEISTRDLVVTHRLSRRPEEYRVRTPAARVARQLIEAGVELSPGEMLRFVYVPGPEKVRAWEGDPGDQAYDVGAYVELLTRAVESLLAAVGVDRSTLETWLLGKAGYWGPPGALPPPGTDIRFPLLAETSNRPLVRVEGAASGAGSEDLFSDVRPPERISLAVDYKTPIGAE
ncbi:MAG: type B DNA-directed DNA polymerase [Anaerolineae bacterium]|nr:MAG: type B DNA-directed DNA polymerase [Anaerolineae bacterium]